MTELARRKHEALLTSIRRLKRLTHEKYAMGGNLKTGSNAPKKVSLAPINLPPLEDDDDHTRD